MRFLAEALDDPTPGPCGQCARCLGRPIVAAGFARSLAIEAARFLKHAELPLECMKQVAAGAFREYGFRGNLPEELRAETGRILSRWRDSGWGQLVADDKHAGHFRDELVEAVAELVRDRWRAGPVLLVDDMVDSAWTLTVVAALLRQAGSGPVWPLALAATSAGD
jgi:ATP-dependent DNA helicase RecQ